MITEEQIIDCLDVYKFAIAKQILKPTWIF
jgi:hypothetical protein